MAFKLFAAPENEPSQSVGFAGNRIDRQSETRSETALSDALNDPLCRVLLFRAGRLHLKLAADRFDAYHHLDQAKALAAKLDDAVLLGRADTGPVVAATVDFEIDDLPANIKAIDNRSVYMQGLVDTQTLGAIAQGASLLTWNANHLFCGRCGAKTEPRIGGYKRVCPECGVESFPRTDPVVIMLTVSGEKCLLGRSPHFGPGMYSCLAGFLEPGETIENAVRRETLEEAGIRLGRVVYHASQPWPFPHSLMIGCFGEALHEDIVFDGKELEDCRWFTRDETRAIIKGTHPDGIMMPPPGAIAAHLVRAWAESE